MKRLSTFTILISVISMVVTGQEKSDYSLIDKMLIYGDYARASDTCRLILSNDSSNADIWYKLGLALQNIMPDTASFSCFMKAYENAPDNSLYKFTMAKGYLSKDKNRKAAVLLTKLCLADSLNWQYAHYMTSIYIQQG